MLKSLILALAAVLLVATPAVAAGGQTDCDLPATSLESQQSLKSLLSDSAAPSMTPVPAPNDSAPEGQRVDLIGGTPCGGVICSGATPVCCNASCSRCVPKGWACTQEACN